MMKRKICAIGFVSICVLGFLTMCRQGNKAKETGSKQAAYYSGNYRNVFSEAGYSAEEIDKKVAKAYHDIFEGPNKIYFEVGDTMAYVSDLKNKL